MVCTFRQSEIIDALENAEVMRILNARAIEALNTPDGEVRIVNAARQLTETFGKSILKILVADGVECKVSEPYTPFILW